MAYSGLGIERTAYSRAWLAILEYVVYIEGGEVRGQGSLQSHQSSGGGHQNFTSRGCIAWL